MAPKPPILLTPEHIAKLQTAASSLAQTFAKALAETFALLCLALHSMALAQLQQAFFEVTGRQPEPGDLEAAIRRGAR